MRSILLAAAGIAFFGTGAASAQTLNPDQARAFVVGRTFAFSCFEGSTGAGRVFPDGSVIGTITFNSQGSARFVRLPPNTVRVRGENVCGFVDGMTFEPCFEVVKTGAATFRGQLAGVETMWCDFTRLSTENPKVASRRKARPSVSAEASAE
ncbi:hypothetical protein [Aquabacter spiritensis]|uniref:Uncharacterized protein n=1 Tax=Aquabacter spiritensis TaxID=933073 RepID=A0A4V2UY01_9HYPH|nr:hypothetical protein [Aquabacter spiritensis]TCT05558.1 hypothetical protein EDC64_104115 [Aquabacter spiritensis]